MSFLCDLLIWNICFMLLVTGCVQRLPTILGSVTLYCSKHEHQFVLLTDQFRLIVITSSSVSMCLITVIQSDVKTIDFQSNASSLKKQKKKKQVALFLYALSSFSLSWYQTVCNLWVINIFIFTPGLVVLSCVLKVIIKLYRPHHCSTQQCNLTTVLSAAEEILHSVIVTHAFASSFSLWSHMYWLWSLAYSK